MIPESVKNKVISLAALLLVLAFACAVAVVCGKLTNALFYIPEFETFVVRCAVLYFLIKFVFACVFYLLDKLGFSISTSIESSCSRKDFDDYEDDDEGDEEYELMRIREETLELASKQAVREGLSGKETIERANEYYNYITGRNASSSTDF